MSKKEVEEEMEGPVEGVDRARRLLDWYLRHRRDLPWRRTRDPYAIWVSEIMLQQTQVAKVEPYFLTFMERFPSVEALAAAPIDDVLASWSGLGYYRRARFLHRAARQLVEDGRSMPRSAAGLQALPGIGAYTAAAVASIAFDEAVPVLDGNVERVICRLLALADDPKSTRVRKRLLAEAAELLVRSRPGESNQALMELGATICRPRSPKCLICPLARSCRGRDDPERYPVTRKKRASEVVAQHVAVVERRGERDGDPDGERLFFRRPRSAKLMAGLWELPNVEATGEALDTEVVERRLGERYGGRWRLEPAVASVRHGITYRSITAFVHPARVETGDLVASGPEAAWVADGDLDDYAMSSLVAKVLAAV